MLSRAFPLYAGWLKLFSIIFEKSVDTAFQWCIMGTIESKQANEGFKMFKAIMFYAGIIATMGYGALSSALTAIGA